MTDNTKETPVVSPIAAFLAFVVAAIDGVNNAKIVSATNEMVTGKNAIVGCEKLTLPKSINPDGKRIDRNEFDAGFTDELAHDFVSERFFESMCRDLHYGIDYGDKQIEKTLKRIAGMRLSLRKKADPDLEDQLVQRLCWLTQQKAQNAYRLPLFGIASDFYKEATNLEWVAPLEDAADTAVANSTAAEAILLTA